MAKQYAVIKIKKDEKIYIYPKCGHICIFDKDNVIVESLDPVGLEFVEVHYEEE